MFMKIRIVHLAILSLLSINTVLAQQEFDVKAHLSRSISSQTNIYNPEAVIPPQCYTKTEGHFNPCYTCHQYTPRREGRANRMNDGELQGDYGFYDVGLTNHWSNLFEDRRPKIKKIDDRSVQNYVNTDNYSALKAKLEKEEWKGWIPDLENLHKGAEAFDDKGFAKDGSGWVAFNYMPLPSTFWPTNGSTDDVMVRLPYKFRANLNGELDEKIYLLNLTVLEAAIKNMRELSIPETQEQELGIDLNQDGKLSVTSVLKRPTHYFGKASDTKVSTFLYPKNTEFLHTVRYVGVDEKTGEIFNPYRMKEVRYMKKKTAHSKSMLGNFFAEEQRDKLEGNLPRYPTLGDQGLDNKFGWVISGFIEDEIGELRPQVYEEQLFCMGCHTTIGSIIDSTFSFPRKPDGAEGWGYINLKKMKDVPTYGEDEGAIKAYMRRVGGGNEFRINEEIKERFFLKDGKLNIEEVEAQKTAYDLITPSIRRALDLNKAYWTIVKDQDFIFGRDANLAPADNVYQEVDPELEPLEAEFRHSSDIRLNWSTEADKLD